MTTLSWILVAGCLSGVPERPSDAWSARDTYQPDSDGDGVGDAADGCPTDPLKTEPGGCGCGVLDTSCAWCGDGALDPGESCDDGNDLDVDGCLSDCTLGDVEVVPVVPAVAGVTNVLHAQGSTPGGVVWFLASMRAGGVAVPGCPGVRTGLANPTVLGGVVASTGGHAFLAVWPPSALAGRRVGFVAVDDATCRVSDIRLETLSFGP